MSRESGYTIPKGLEEQRPYAIRGALASAPSPTRTYYQPIFVCETYEYKINTSRDMPFVGSVEGKMAFGRTTANSIPVSSNMLLYLDAGNRTSYPGTGTTWTDLSANDNDATGLTGTTYSSLNGGYLSFNGTTGSGNLDANKYNTPYTGKTVFVAGNLSSIDIGTYRAFLGASAGSRNFNFYMYRPSSGVYQLHFSAGGGTLSGNLSYTPGNWFTAAVTQATDQTTVYYFNGQQVSQDTMAFAQFLTGSTERVGRADNFWNGPLPIICVYKTNLTAAQILANHNAVRGRYGLA